MSAVTAPPLHWVDELPASTHAHRKPRVDPQQEAVARSLMANPGRWAIVERGANASRGRIHNRGMALSRRATGSYRIESAIRIVDGACHLYARAVQR